MKAVRAILLAMLLILGSGTAPARGAHGSIVVNEQTKGLVKAKPGEAVEIRLRSQPGTGFSWVSTNYALKLTPLPPIERQAIPGGWQTQRFRFVAKRAGTYRLTFSYDQPWKGGAKGARTATFRIKVR